MSTAVRSPAYVPRRSGHRPENVAGPTVSVIVPTYREAENLRLLIPEVFDSLAAAGETAEMIIVDDDSPDDTRAVCEALGNTCDLQLVVRHGERGLSSAVVHGMALASGETLVVMDADLSHPPASVPALVAALRRPDVDLVVGSRYVAGGSTDDCWGLFRQINSRVATALARPLTSIHDPMAGFFAIRKARFDACRDRLNPVGYKIGLELLVKCDCRVVVEVPIAFRDRRYGSSKLSAKEQFNYLRHIGRLFTYKCRARR